MYPWAIQFPRGLIRDDGYFYAQIAYNLAEHGSSSIDLINSTDGYHQTWALILAGVSFILSPFTAAKSAHLFVYIAVNLYVIILTIRLLALRGLAAIAFFFLLVSCGLLMESHLVLLLCVVALRGLELSSVRASPALLIAMALIPLTRIDATLVVVFLIGAAAISGRLPVAAAMVAALVAGLAAHFTYLRLLHSSFFTVSSELKASIGRGLREQVLVNAGLRGPPTDSPIRINELLAVFILLAIAGVWLWLTTPALRERKELTALWLGVLVFTAGHGLVNQLRPWYFTLGFGVFGYAVFAGISLLAIRWRRPTLAAAVAVMITPAILAAYLAIQQRDEARDVRAFIRSVDANVPAGTPIFMVDGSGLFAWSTNRPIVNGDGLVNSHAYAQRLKDDALAGYLAETGIRFFITNRSPADAPVLIDIGGLVVRNEDAKLIAEKPGGYRYRFTQFQLWELKTSN